MFRQILQPKFILVALALLCVGQQQTKANPIPDSDDTVKTVKDQVTGFFDRLKNTFSGADETKPKLTTLEIALISVGAILILVFLSCCILACLCECVKEILCCICCCGRNT